MGGTDDLTPVPRARRIERLTAAFEQRFGRGPEGFAEAPGRVNLIGGHLDYNLGWVLPVAIDRTVLAAFARRTDRQVRAYALDFDEVGCFPLDDLSAGDDLPWLRYLQGVAWALEEAGYRLPGLDLALQGDVPIGAGLSSSAAVEVAVIGAFRHAGRLPLELPDAALLGQRAENQYVGVHCGIMDQFAAALAHAGHALRIDCRTLDYEPILLPLDEWGLRIVIVDSAVRRELRSSPYNRRRQECAEALALLQRALPERCLESLVDVTEGDLRHVAGRLPPPLDRRVRHVVSEQARVKAAVAALRRGDLEAVGTLLRQSHVSLRDDYQVSAPQLDLLVELATQVSGVLGSRLTGAGFGGCTIHLVRSKALPAFQQEVFDRYRAQTGLPARLYVSTAYEGLRPWDAA